MSKKLLSTVTPEDVLAESEKTFQKPDYLRLEDDLPSVEEINAIADDMIGDAEDVQDVQAMDAAMPNNTPPLSIVYETMTISEYIELSKTLDASRAYQRPIVWRDEDRDYLIDSILNGFDINVISLHGDAILDGKQRTNCLSLIFNGLHTPKTLEGDLEELNGKMFATWESDMRERFLNHPITIKRYPNSWDDDTACEQFMRTNKSGRVLTNAQVYKMKTRDKAQALSSSINSDLWRITKENAKKEIVSAYGKMNIEELYFFLIHLLYAEKKDYKTSNLYKWLVSFRFEDHHNLIGNIFNRTRIVEFIFRQMETHGNDGIKARNFYCKKVHMLSLLAAIDEHTDIMQAAANLVTYWQWKNDKEGKKRSEVTSYSNLCNEGTNDAKAIEKRLEFMKKLLANASMSVKK